MAEGTHREFMHVPVYIRDCGAGASGDQGI